MIRIVEALSYSEIIKIVETFYIVCFLCIQPQSIVTYIKLARAKLLQLIGAYVSQEHQEDRKSVIARGSRLLCIAHLTSNIGL